MGVLGCYQVAVKELVVHLKAVTVIKLVKNSTTAVLMFHHNLTVLNQKVANIYCNSFVLHQPYSMCAAGTLLNVLQN